jgi:hypothetical protein
MVHTLVARAAFDGQQIEIDAFGLHGAITQGLQVIIFVARHGKLQFGHGLIPSWGLMGTTILQLLTPVNE